VQTEQISTQSLKTVLIFQFISGIILFLCSIVVNKNHATKFMWCFKAYSFMK